MADGQSLEHTGVTPDEVLLRSAHASKRPRSGSGSRGRNDGGKDYPDDAGKAFLYEWAPED